MRLPRSISPGALPTALAAALLFCGAGAASAASDFNGPVAVPSGISIPACGTTLTPGGSINVRAHVVDSTSGNVHVQVHATADGLTATDSAGNTYTFHGVANAELNLRPNVAGEATLTGNITANGSGPLGGDHAHIVAHITVNNNNDISVAFVKVMVDCK
jgi:hypothetical protein